MPSTGYKLVRLPHGVHSVHSLAHGETFHPAIGPEAEAEALYVRQLRMVDRIRANSNWGEFVIWDVGLGAGANVLTVLRAARGIAGSIRIVSFDRTLDPLRFALSHCEALGFLAAYETTVRTLIEKHRVAVTDGGQRLDWEVHVADFPILLSQPIMAGLPKPHAILFDAFSPATNPEMWTLDVFSNLFRLLDPSRACVLSTYSRSTMLRVSLLLAGFYVGAGHATGEKEETTIAANALEWIAEPLDRQWLQRARRSTSAEPLREPVYRQARLAPETWEKLQDHPQFNRIEGSLCSPRT